MRFKNTNIQKLIHDKHSSFLVCILFLALILRMWGISFGLPGIDHGDESEVVNHAVRFGSGDLNPHRFQYGSLFQYILFLFYAAYFVIGYGLGIFPTVHQFAIHFVQDPTVFYMIARIISAVLGTATVGLVYLIGNRVLNKKSGLIAALFLSCCYEHVIHSHYATVDAALTFFFTLAIYRCLILFTENSMRSYRVAGFCIGLCFATKFNGFFAVTALLGAHFLQEDTASFKKKIFSKKLWSSLLFIFIGHAAACPFFYLEIPQVLQEIYQLKTMHASSGCTIMLYIRFIINEFWGKPLGLIGLLGMLIASVGGRKMLMLFITTLCILCFASQHMFVEAKYILCAFPMLAVFGAFLTKMSLDCIRKQNVYSYFIIIPLLLLHPLYLSINWDQEHAQKSLNLVAKEWIEANIPVNARMLLDNTGNDGPKLANSPKNIKGQFQRAKEHGLMKSEYLKLKLEACTTIYYDIIQIDSSAGSRDDDYLQYKLWEDLEQIGKPAAYYRKIGIEYVIITDRYFNKTGEDFLLIKKFEQGRKGIYIYKITG